MITYYSTKPVWGAVVTSSDLFNKAADGLMIEINPAQSVELINRYEKLCGLPDKCLANRKQTIGERQQVLDAKVNTVGGISEAFFKKQLEILGYPTATIEQFQHIDSTTRSVLV
ncbi:putative phage tail protein [Candidatus Symbiopectobacterium sp.]|uniref:putative phage tail protein n=1 Tax=Candidatus Symbiopectobacterium sp. TaxID=2816440 RepID=UPI00345D4E18